VTTSERLDALDVFRGLTVATMILVSTPGSWDGVYPAIEHAPWNGWTLADLVFPFLLFAMGAAVPFALARRRAAAKRVQTHIVRRALILFGLGLLLNAIAAAPPLHLATFRIPGVLQRIAIVYAAVAWMTERWSTRAQLVGALAILAGYWAILASRPLSAEHNIGAIIDQRIFGPHMLYPLWDPEGLLSTLPAIASALAGVFAGDWLKTRCQAPTVAGTVWLFAAGAAATGVALAWSTVLPINKNLWTSAYALFTAGLATQTLAVCHWILDIRRWRWWDRPFVALGRNALAAYFLSVGLDSVLARWTVSPGVSLKSMIYRNAFASWLRPCCGTEAASLAYALAYVALWSIVLMEMQRRRIFIAI
jgi:predicted acyltransferase